MRRYIDIISDYIAESIMSQLEVVPMPDNSSREIGAAGQSVAASMTDMLPHNNVRNRNKPRPYSEIFAKAVGAAHNDSFAREEAPTPRQIKSRRNNDAGIRKLSHVPEKGDASANLHHDFAGREPVTRSLIPVRK